jgi:hypothetical protein
MLDKRLTLYVQSYRKCVIQSNILIVEAEIIGNRYLKLINNAISNLEANTLYEQAIGEIENLAIVTDPTLFQNMKQDYLNQLATSRASLPPLLFINIDLDYNRYINIIPTLTTIYEITNAYCQISDLMNLSLTKDRLAVDLRNLINVYALTATTEQITQMNAMFNDFLIQVYPLNLETQINTLFQVYKQNITIYMGG